MENRFKRMGLENLRSELERIKIEQSNLSTKYNAGQINALNLECSYILKYIKKK